MGFIPDAERLLLGYGGFVKQDQQDVYRFRFCFGISTCFLWDQWRSKDWFKYNAILQSGWITSITLKWFNIDIICLCILRCQVETKKTWCMPQKNSPRIPPQKGPEGTDEKAKRMKTIKRL